jgi:hypothetical protein
MQKILNNPHQMIPGQKYKITFPCYDDYDENLKPEVSMVEVVKKMKYAFLLKDLEYNNSFESTFLTLMLCQIKEI